MEAEIAELRRTTVGQPGEARDAALLEEAAKLAIRFTAVPGDVLGPAPANMKTLAAIGEKIAAAIRALPVSGHAGQPLIGKLMDEISQLPHLFPDGCKEPGALLRQSDVQRVLVAASKAAPIVASLAAGREGGAS